MRQMSTIGDHLLPTFRWRGSFQTLATFNPLITIHTLPTFAPLSILLPDSSGLHLRQEHLVGS
jgi:hypothetical protein